MKALAAADRTSEQILADAMPTLVMMSDKHGTVTYFNEQWFAYTGQPSFQHDTNWDWRDYMHPEDGPRVAEDWQHAIDSGHDTVHMTYRLREARTGDYRWFRASAVAIRDDMGAIARWIGTAVDIDAERRAREELASMYEREHSVADAFQQASLPPGLPTVEGVQLDAFYKPGATDLIVGGDWYDAFVTRSGALVLSIGDVMGHGLDAAVIMGKIRNSIRALMLRAPDATVDLPGLLVAVERALESEAPDASATAFIGLVSPDHRRLDYASAGHPPPLLRTRSGAARWLDTVGAPLGWSFGTPREQRQVSLDRPCALVLYTDGLVEASRDIGTGLLTLSQVVERGDVLHDKSPASAILSQGACAEPSDDVAILTAIFAAQIAG